MLRVTVEILSGGKRKTLGVLDIANESNLAPVSDYSIWDVVSLTKMKPPTDLTRRLVGTVHGHTRSLGFWPLVQRAIGVVLGQGGLHDAGAEVARLQAALDRTAVALGLPEDVAPIDRIWEEAARLADADGTPEGADPWDKHDGWSYKTAKLTGKLCSICRTPQVESPSGVTCAIGHGGAESLP